ncbi:DUF4177 domain-containing protein [Rodentibacter pneumotropicus]|uniref:DUF4177 domain-containing protein n=1 Tax=Rodentibacter pneumotropicus TaxID=758 RepID=A0A4S2Q2J9_9PAST|nr:DUF4177 domain-containing protein [Rodentibacter pneumotropicus]NBH76354.1 DUF4177 domain-containing protein [Rodentibacter pneumotropicus]THA04131.1 DUF4177 domain-containing protein [Rodentibacter pneumotropicus]THA08974.1 DUF4177 domain-containing protein [Rodentibacter pneumotropicus]THA10721.1 DUF4177 domain-containing protein [Rodentibacter pneumotropicus]THA14262.1 DUF4177 domain-containing protein [Rodentibacter pneumotropicus]
MKYEYKMIQVPPNIIASRKNITTAAADYLQDVVNEWAERGWEFWRVDDFATEEKSGCFSGGKSTMHIYKVITFRKEI